MTEMEMDIAGDIMMWSMETFKGIEDITHPDMVYKYWQDIFDSCAMGQVTNGMEMPHEDSNYWNHFSL